LIIDKDILGEIFSSPEEYKKFAREIVETREYEILNDIKLE